MNRVQEQKRQLLKKWLLFITLMASALLVSCRKSEVDLAVEEHDKEVEQCSNELAKKAPMIPIIGGGYLDTHYYAFNVPSVVYTDGECGTDTFVTDLYWTGQKIVPAKEEFTGMLAGAVPSHWLRFGIGVRFGNRRWAKACRTNPDSEKCPEWETPGYPPTWPQELVVKPKHYPGLEIWLPRNRVKGVDAITFTLTDWKKENGRPRSVNCWALEGYSPWQMTREQFEDIDFGTHKFPCQVEYWDFAFKGGAARVHTGTEALKDITTALKALHQYISNSIIQEE